MHTCAFVGHHAAANSKDAMEIPAALSGAIEELLALDDEFYFYFGDGGWFDELSAGAVYRLRAEHPEKVIRMMLALPYEREVAARELYDEVFVPAALRRLEAKDAVPARDRWLVEHSQYLVAYVRYGKDAAAAALSYARSLNANIRLL